MNFYIFAIILIISILTIDSFLVTTLKSNFQTRILQRLASTTETVEKELKTLAGLVCS